MTASPTQDPTRGALRRVGTAAIVGSALEWYDFFLYATAAALVLGPVFFPTHDPATGVLLSFATFGAGFIARPLGSIFFGNLGDRVGRKPVLVATLVLMGLASAGMGLVPSYAAIGVWAPVLLLVLRLLQGFGAGAELAGASIFAAEFAPPSRRGLFGSLGSSGVYIGVLVSSLAFALVGLLPEAEFLAWGWRIPFLASVLLVGVGLFVRLRLDETPTFRNEVADEPRKRTERLPVASLLRTEWRTVLVVMGVVAAPFVGTYVYQSYSLSYLAGQLKMPASTGTTAVTIAAAVAVLGVPLFGALSDRFGRRPVLIAGAVYSAAFAFPFFWLLESRTLLGAVVAMVGGVGIGVPIMLGTQGAMLTELFSTRHRFSGFSVSRELSSVVFAGLSPLIAAALASAAGGASWPVAVYVIACCALTLAVAFVVPETSTVSLTDTDSAHSLDRTELTDRPTRHPARNDVC